MDPEKPNPPILDYANDREPPWKALLRRIYAAMKRHWLLTWKSRLHRIYAVMQRHWLLPWKIVAVLMLVYIPTQWIARSANDKYQNTRQNLILDENLKNEIATLKVLSLLKNRPQEKNPIEFVKEQLGHGELKIIQNPEPQTQNDLPDDIFSQLSWTDPDGGTAKMLINSAGKVQMEISSGWQTNVPDPFWIGLSAAYDGLQVEVLSLIVGIFCVVGVIWIAAFAFRTNEQRLKSALHLLFLSLTGSILLGSIPKYWDLHREEPWVWIFGNGISGLACSLCLPRKILFKHRAIWIFIFTGWVLLATGGLMRTSTPYINHVFNVSLVDADQVDQLVPASIRQSTVPPDGQLLYPAKYLPAQTAEIDNSTAEAIIRKNAKSTYISSESWTFSQWAQWDCFGEVKISIQNPELQGLGSIQLNYSETLTSRPRIQIDGWMIYCEDGKLITLTPTTWECELLQQKRSRVFLYECSTCDGKRKYMVVVWNPIFHDFD